MEVITIETKIFKHLIQRIENMEQMMLSVLKVMQQDKDLKSNIQPEYITRQQAMNEFQISKTTVDFKVKKYNVSRLPAGGKLLLNRLEFITALRNKEQFDKVINRSEIGIKT